MDGTAKGGVVLRVSQKYNLMIHAIGTGEGIEDLEDFSATNFAKSLLEI
ncbi:SRP54-type, GTPase domain protein [Anaplasma phagocytophilum str. CR1007]|nr:SRP54-type, GTPase domain protein [Anaplasma phagocytophilum str. CR1007]